MALPGSILVACSNREWNQSLSAILGAWGMKVSGAHTMEEARKVLRKQAVLLVFAEQDLPGGSLRQLLDELASRIPTVRLIALIPDEAKYGEAIASGAFEAMAIPCLRSEVQWMVIQGLREAAIKNPTMISAGPPGCS